MSDKHTLATVNAGNQPVYIFTDHDEYKIKLEVKGAGQEQYVLLDKQALRELSSTLNDLASQFLRGRNRGREF